MIGDLRLKKLHEFFEGYSKEELIWVNGYLSGLVSNGKLNNGTADTNGQDHKAVSTKKITLAFGTETGNSKKLATQLAAAGKKHGVIVKLADLSQYRVADLPKEDFFSLIYKNAEVARKFIELLSDSLLENEQQLMRLAYNSVRKRVAEALVKLSDTYKNETDLQFSMHVSREDLANLVGTAKETLIRTLSDFKEEKYIEISGGKITILDYEKLVCMRN